MELLADTKRIQNLVGKSFGNRPVGIQKGWNARFKAFTAMKIQFMVFSVVKPCSHVGG
jgi:hypothetical protein